MKKSIITLLFLSFYSIGHSCSFSISPFCRAITISAPENIIMRGYFSDELANGMVFTRLETLRGEESRDQINVWDNIPIDCNGTFWREASMMAGIDQEIIISLTLIDSLISDFEVIGDYRAPDGIWREAHSLGVIDGNVTGLIFSLPDNSTTTMPYDQFVQQVIVDEQCIISSTATPTNQPFKIYPTLVTDHIQIDYDSEIESSTLQIYDASGRLVLSNNISPVFDLAVLEKGMYIVMITTSKNKCYHQKIVRI